MDIIDQVQLGEVGMRDYAKYILREGTIVEKRLFMTSLRDRIILSGKRIYIKQQPISLA